MKTIYTVATNTSSVGKSLAKSLRYVASITDIDSSIPKYTIVHALLNAMESLYSDDVPAYLVKGTLKGDLITWHTIIGDLPSPNFSSLQEAFTLLTRYNYEIR